MFTFLSILLLIFQIFCVSIPIINKNRDSNERHVVYTTWDKALLTFSVIAFGLSIAIILIGQDSENEKETRNKEYQTELKNKLAERDSLHKIDDSAQTKYFIERLDSSYTKSIKASNDALAKYNLELVDSLNRVTNKINTKSNNRPQFSISAAASGATPPMYMIKKDEQNLLAVKVVSNNNTSYNIEIRFYILGYEEERNKLFFSTIDTGGIFYDSKFLVQDVSSTAFIRIKPELMQIQNSIVYFNGSFSADFENKDVSNFEAAYFFDFKHNKQQGALDASSISSIKSKLQKRGIMK